MKKFLNFGVFDVFMGLIFSNKTDQKLELLHSVLSDSFAKVKQDSTLLSQWVEYLYHLSIEQQRSMNDLRTRNNQLHSSLIELERHNRRQNDLVRDLTLQLKNMPTTREDIRKIVDSFYSFEPILARLKHMEHKLSDFEAQKAAHPQIAALPPVSIHKEMPSLKEKILRRITRNSKNFMKSSILSLVAKYGKISALQMREIIVEEQGLCSKSSFYRLLDEIEKTQGLRFVVDGKEKVYFADSNSHLKPEHLKPH